MKNRNSIYFGIMGVATTFMVLGTELDTKLSNKLPAHIHPENNSYQIIVAPSAVIATSGTLAMLVSTA